MTTKLFGASIAALLLGWSAPSIAQDEPASAGPLLVQDVTCAGNVETSCAFIREHLYLRAGDPLDEEQVRNAELRLSALTNFESVKIRLEKGAERGAVVVVIEVVEANPIATESLFGISSRLDLTSGVVAGRISNLNLFGEGKFADFTAMAAVPIAGDGRREAYGFTLRYADPQLFGSRRYFGVVSAGWKKHDFVDSHGNFSHLDTPQFDISVGRRFADFSYVSTTFNYRPGGEWISGGWTGDGVLDIKVPANFEATWNLAYGWSSEDNLHFPTQGSTFEIAYGGETGSGSGERRSHIQFRKTWPIAGGYWTLQFGGDPRPEYRSSLDESQMLALSFARPIAPGAEIQRGRWYVEPGLSFGGYTRSGDAIQEYGLKAGFRAETRTFGLIDLYLIGSVGTEK
jgi:outer membrane protein assembly factor BamA